MREELEDDARAAVTFLVGRSEIDHQRTYIFGHSLGGLVVPQIARDNPQMAGIVLMGAPSGDPLALLLRRSENAVQLGSETGKLASASVPVFKQLMSGKPASTETVELFGEPTPVSYWLELRNYDAGVLTIKLEIPALILSAGHDAEVLPNDFETWQAAVASKGNTTCKFYPSLFHLFMASTATERGVDAPKRLGPSWPRCTGGRE